MNVRFRILVAAALALFGAGRSAALSADANGDCKIDLRDFALLAAQWLGCNIEPKTVCWN